MFIKIAFSPFVNWYLGVTHDSRHNSRHSVWKSFDEGFRIRYVSLLASVLPLVIWWQIRIAEYNKFWWMESKMFSISLYQFCLVWIKRTKRLRQVLRFAVQFLWVILKRRAWPESDKVSIYSFNPNHLIFFFFTKKTVAIFKWETKSLFLSATDNTIHHIKICHRGKMRSKKRMRGGRNWIW